MASSFSPNLAIELIGTGDQAGQWGNTTNTNLGTLIEQSISGYVTQAVATGTDTTITIPNGATGVARNMYIELTGTGGASTNLIVPANKKLYFIFNNTASGQVTVKVSGQTGVSVPNKAKVILVSNGTDIIDATNFIGSAVIGNLTATSGTITTLASSSAVITQLNSTSGTISTLASTSAAITTLSGTTLTYSSGTITNLSATSLTLSNNPTLSGGTANGVLYLNGSKVATSGSALTFSGTLLTVGGSNADLLRIQGTTQNLYFTPDSSGVFVTTATGGGGTGLYCAGSVDVLTFRTGGTEKMRLDSSGNLGIGTSTPSAKLHVAGTIRSGATGASGRVEISRSSDGAVVGFLYNPTGDVFAIAQGGGGSGNPIAFYTAGTEKMRLDEPGNLGLGVTPSAWSTGKAAEIGSVGSSVWGLSSGTTYFTAGYYFNTADKFAITGNYALFSQLVPADGSFRWVSSTATGTAGNNATMTERLRLDSSGNLGLGVTPANGAGPAYKSFELGVVGCGLLNRGIQDTWVMSNVAYDSGANLKYAANGTAAYLIVDNAGAFSFSTAPNNTSGAGAAMSPTVRLSISNAGAVAIGGTAQFGSTISVGNATPAASGAGVTFPATQSASSDANTLDDYEEGDWTPTYVSTGATFTYNSNTGGKYTKIGNRVYISGFLQTDSASGGTAANAVQIGGLPFTVAAWGPGRDYSLILCDEVEEFAGDYPSAARAQPNDAVATLFYRDTADGASIALRYDDLATGSSDNLMGFTGFYRTA